MPLSRVRCCIPCGRIRYAPCSTGCRVDPENDPTSWTEQVRLDTADCPEPQDN